MLRLSYDVDRVPNHGTIIAAFQPYRAQTRAPFDGLAALCVLHRIKMATSEIVMCRQVFANCIY